MPTGTCSKFAIVDELDFVAFMGVGNAVLPPNNYGVLCDNPTMATK